jgi:enterochelin esterase family protein
LRSPRRFAVSALLVLILAAGIGAQGPRSAGGPPPAVRSPDVHDDRRVTFRLRAPDASRVELVGEVLQGAGPQAITRRADGIWSITVGPLPPEIWIYNFRVEGVDLPDPANISQMPRLRADFDPGDHVHPNDAGNAAMAAAIDVTVFR